MFQLLQYKFNKKKQKKKQYIMSNDLKNSQSEGQTAAQKIMTDIIWKHK